MVTGVGIDLIEKKRVQKAIEREGFLKRVYTQNEQELIAVRKARAASNFAAKEAVAKALGCGFAGIRPEEIEVLRHPSGQPYVVLHGAAKEKAEEAGVERILISITDTAELAQAVAVLEGRRREAVNDVPVDEGAGFEAKKQVESDAAIWEDGIFTLPKGEEGDVAVQESLLGKLWREKPGVVRREELSDGEFLLTQLSGKKDGEGQAEEYLPVLTAAGAKEVDQRTMAEYGIPSLTLMERAACAVTECVLSYVTKESVTGVLCGTGNNGGDGLAVARRLADAGYPVKVFLKDAKKWKEFCEANENLRNTAEKDSPQNTEEKEALRDTAENVQDVPEGKLGKETEKRQKKPSCTEEFWQQLLLAKAAGVLFYDFTELEDCDIFVDALFGIGLARDITGSYEEVIRRVNGFKSPVIAVDIASGISADTGAVCGVAVRAAETVTFGAAKCGHLFYPGKEHTGKLQIAEIGFPKELLWEKREGIYFGDYPEGEAPFMAGSLPKRPAYSNKGTFGKVAVLAGSKNMAGAAYFSAYAAYRSGAGLVKIVTPEYNREILQTKLPEAMLTTYYDGAGDSVGKPIASAGDGDGMESGKISEGGAEAAQGAAEGNTKHTIAGAVADALRFADALVIGPGIGKGASARKLVQEIAEALKRLGEKAPVSVWDADALNLLAEEMDTAGCTGIEARRDFLAEKLPQNAVLTPHPGELSRLTGVPVSELIGRLLQIADVLTKGNTLTFVLKDAVTVVAQGEEKFVQTAGNSGMATGGSGDVLTGVIAALAAGKQPNVERLQIAGKTQTEGRNQKEGKTQTEGKIRIEGIFSTEGKIDTSFWAAIHGVWLHGLAGDAAAGRLGEAPLMASDIAYALSGVLTRNMAEE